MNVALHVLPVYWYVIPGYCSWVLYLVLIQVLNLGSGTWYGTELGIILLIIIFKKVFK